MEKEEKVEVLSILKVARVQVLKEQLAIGKEQTKVNIIAPY